MNICYFSFLFYLFLFFGGIMITLFKNRVVSWVLRIVSVVIIVVAAFEVFVPSAPKVIISEAALPVQMIKVTYNWYSYQTREFWYDFPSEFILAKDATLQDAVDKVHASIRYSDDIDAYGWTEYYASAAEVLATGKGDCDEFATIWYQMLKRNGFSTGMAAGYIGNNIETSHIVALVKVDNSIYVLDLNEREPIELNKWIDLHQATLMIVADGYKVTTFNSWINK